jgi:hypothetical protein
MLARPRRLPRHRSAEGHGKDQDWSEALVAPPPTTIKLFGDTSFAFLANSQDHSQFQMYAEMPIMSVAKHELDISSILDLK